VRQLVERLKVAAVGFSGEISFRTPSEKQESVYFALAMLEANLERRRKIHLTRPSKLIDWGDADDGEFYRERMIATKVVFPKEIVEQVGGLNALVVWVSDPDTDQLGSERDTNTSAPSFT
jgi:hypothetical protein